ncbi:MAG: polysaccharide deacetylase family protein [Pyrinomonadaceae bacterium]|nr:polysaccharide deacetylase family protein [Pyrinomonadaceae bacterium]
MLKTIKQNLLKSAKMLRFFDLSSKSRWRQNKLLILAYHGISLEDEHRWDSSLYMPPDLLRRRFELIKQHDCPVLPLNEAVERLYSQTLPKKAVVITFDDGNYDFYQRAFPIIKEFGFPATLYLTTFYSGYHKPIFNVAAKYLLWKAQSKTLDCRTLLGRGEQINLATEVERQKAYDLLFAHALENKFSAEQKNDLLEEMCGNLQIDYAEFCAKRLMQLMNAAEVSKIAAAGVDVQLHTHRHRVPLEERLFRREIEDNRRAITAAADYRATHFCYPSGEHDARFFPWMEAEGVVSATTCETALSTSQTNRFLLPRLVDTCSLSEVEFEGWLTGISHFLPQRKTS